VNARASIVGEEAMDSVQDVVNDITAHWNNNGNTPFTLAIIDHGRSGLQSMGDGDVTVAGKFIDNLARSASDRQDFIDACDGKVTTVTLYGCNVAEGSDGDELLEMLATGANMTVKAHTGSVYATHSTVSGYRWEASNLGHVVTEAP
jgi:hypothetical protein